MTALDVALGQILTDAGRVGDCETVALDAALGRVLAEPLMARTDVPPWDNSAMDGYAVRSADLCSGAGDLSVVQRIPAGDVGEALESGTAARIFTGAALPVGADAVVMQEDATVEGRRLRCLVGVAPGDNVRLRGQDMPAGSLALPPGKRLKPQDLGVAAAVGAARLRVRRKLKVGLFSTGNELREPGEALGAGQIYNSNRATLVGLLQALDLECRDFGIVADDPALTQRVLREASGCCDVLVGSGGVSVGEEDHVKRAVLALGDLKLWKLAIKPGKPLAYGRVCGVPFFGLPGNPAAVFVTFGLVVKPYLMAMQGIDEPPHVMIRVRAGFDWPRPGRRREYLRASLARKDDGELMASVFGNQSSGVLSLVSRADCLLIMPVGQRCRRGDWLDAVLMKDWVY